MPDPEWSKICQGLIARMPHTKNDSNRTASSGCEDVLVSYVKIGERPLSLLPGTNRHAEHNLTSRHAPEAPHINFSAFGPVVSDKIFK